MLFAAVTASPNTVQILALIAAVLFVVAALVAFLRPAVMAIAHGLVAAGLVLVALAIIYLV
jgi:hypothetical protein